jgi:hypothetical protein
VNSYELRTNLRKLLGFHVGEYLDMPINIVKIELQLDKNLWRAPSLTELFLIIRQLSIMDLFNYFS